MASRDGRNVDNPITPWDDFDYLIQTHAADDVGLNSKDTDGICVHVAAKRLQRTLGVTAIEQRRYREHDIYPERAPLPQLIVYTGRFATKSTLMDLEDGELAMNARLGLTNTYGIQRGVIGKLAGKLIENSELPDDDVVRLWKERQQLTPVQLLKVMATSLESPCPELRLPRLCCRLLQVVG